MLNKETFVNLINQSQENILWENKINELFDASFCNPLSYTLIQVVEEAMNLNGEYDTLSWWMYETDFGKLNAKIEINKKEIDVSTAEKLYDYLLKYEQKEETK